MLTFLKCPSGHYFILPNLSLICQIKSFLFYLTFFLFYFILYLDKMIRKFLLGIIINCFALYICQRLFQYLFNDFIFKGSLSQFLLLALVLTLLNLLVKPILKFFFAPLIFLTLGIFSLIVNLIILKLAIYFVPQLEIKYSLTWIGASLLISLFNSFFLK